MVVAVAVAVARNELLPVAVVVVVAWRLLPVVVAVALENSRVARRRKELAVAAAVDQRPRTQKEGLQLPVVTRAVVVAALFVAGIGPERLALDQLPPRHHRLHRRRKGLLPRIVVVAMETFVVAAVVVQRSVVTFYLAHRSVPL